MNRVLKNGEDEANPTKDPPSEAKAALKLVGLNVRAEARTLHEIIFSASCKSVQQSDSQKGLVAHWS
jgi:hypothetical protein